MLPRPSCGQKRQSNSWGMLPRIGLIVRLARIPWAISDESRGHRWSHVQRLMWSGVVILYMPVIEEAPSCTSWLPISQNTRKLGSGDGANPLAFEQSGLRSANAGWPHASKRPISVQSAYFKAIETIAGGEEAWFRVIIQTI